MKVNTILLILSAGLLVLLCACGAAKKPLPDTPNQTESGGDPLEITAFSFSHGGSLTYDCFLLELTREDSGTHVRAEELFSGGRAVDTTVGTDALEQLGELAGQYHVDRWDGFDKTGKRVSDGSHFHLNITLADGSTISAHGNNAFPEYYADVYDYVLEMYTAFMDQYATEGGNAS